MIRNKWCKSQKNIYPKTDLIQLGIKHAYASEALVNLEELIECTLPCYLDGLQLNKISAGFQCRYRTAFIPFLYEIKVVIQQINFPRIPIAHSFTLDRVILNGFLIF
jgi:hypothetical protein